MKKLIVLTVTILSLASITNAQIVKDGFRGHEWGTHINDMDTSLALELSHIDSTEHTKQYIAYAITSLGGAEIESCTFTFFKDRFYAVYVIARGTSNSSQLLAALVQVYGEPKIPNRYMDKYEWDKRKTFRHYKINSITRDGTLLMYSKVILKEMVKGGMEKAKNSKDDF